MAIIDQQLTTVDTFFVFTLGHTCLNKEHKKKQQKKYKPESISSRRQKQLQGKRC